MNSCRRRFLVKRQVFPTIFDLQALSRDTISCLSNLQKISLFDVINKPDVVRGGSRIPTTSKTEFSMKIVNGLKL